MLFLSNVTRINIFGCWKGITKNQSMPAFFFPVTRKAPKKSGRWRVRILVQLHGQANYDDLRVMRFLNVFPFSFSSLFSRLLSYKSSFIKGKSNDSSVPKSVVLNEKHTDEASLWLFF